MERAVAKYCGKKIAETLKKIIQQLQEQTKKKNGDKKVGSQI